MPETRKSSEKSVFHSRSLISRRLIDSSKNSLAGLRILWDEEAFRVEAILIAPLLPLAIWLGDTAVEQALMIASLVVILIVEAINTAVEKTIDRISMEIHPLSGHAKDLGSSAVLMAIVLAVLVWGLILLN